MLSVARNVSRPKVSFNPDGYRRARKAYDTGDAGLIIAMMHEASLDSHVAGCLMGRRAGFKRPFSLLSYEDTDTDNERRDWVQGVLERLRLRDLLEAIHDGRLYVYAVVDFDWEVIDGRQVPVRFEDFPQHAFKRDTDGIIKQVVGNDLVELPETTLVVEGRRTRTALMAPVLRDWILKEFGLESWASFLENFGEPFLMAYYPQGAGEAFRKEVEAGLEALAASARGTAPDGTKLTVHESGRNTSDHDAFTDRADRGIAITLLGHANAVEQGSGLQIGDHPSSFEAKHEVSVDDCFWIEPYVNRLIQTIWARNFGDSRYPRFELHKSKPVDAKVHMDILDVAYRHGLKLHPDEYRKAGLYVYDDQPPIVRPTDALASAFLP